MFDLDYDNFQPSDNFHDVQVVDPRDHGNNTILPLIYSIEDLDTFCEYVIDLKSEYLSRSALSNAKIMFDIMDKRPYFNNDSLKARLEYIQLVLEARIDKNLTTKRLIDSYVLRNCDSNLKDIIEEEIINGLSKIKLSDATCEYLTDIIFENLINGYSLGYSKKLMDLFDKKDSGY